MPRLPKRKWPIFAAMLTAAGLAVGLACACLRLDELVFTRISEDALANATDADVPELLGRLAGLGDPGSAALVRALTSPRSGVARGAAQALEAELDRWSRLPTDVAEPKLAELARRLAIEAESMPAPAQASARRLAMRIVRWPLSGSSLDRAEVLLACERILNAQPVPKLVKGIPTNLPKRRPRNKQAAAQAQSSHRAKKTRLATWPRPTLLAEQMAGGGLPPSDLARPRATDIAEPPRFIPGESKPLADAKRSDDLSNFSAVAVTGAAASERDAQEFDRLNTFEVFARLHDEESIARRAADQLARRGFTARQIEVGRHLTSPDAHERHQWVEALPGIREVEAKAWLLHLTRDQSVAVRRAAITLLATNRDPEVLRRMSELATQESDPELRAEAEAVCDGLEALGAAR